MEVGMDEEGYQSAQTEGSAAASEGTKGGNPRDGLGAVEARRYKRGGGVFNDK